MNRIPNRITTVSWPHNQQLTITVKLFKKYTGHQLSVRNRSLQLNKQLTKSWPHKSMIESRAKMREIPMMQRKITIINYTASSPGQKPLQKSVSFVGKPWSPIIKKIEQCFLRTVWNTNIKHSLLQWLIEWASKQSQILSWRTSITTWFRFSSGKPLSSSQIFHSNSPLFMTQTQARSHFQS